MHQLTMTSASFAVRALLTTLGFLVVAVVIGYRASDPHGSSAAGTAVSASTAPATESPGFLYGRITTVDGASFQGRLRWGGDQEAFWSDYFNGTKDGNPWLVHASGEVVHEDRDAVEIFGIRFGSPDPANRFKRLFMARFGDIARIDAHMRDVQVTLKSGTVVALDRFAAGDIDDGVRVWDRSHGVVDLDARRIQTIEFLPTTPLSGAPGRLHGTVYTPHGNFTGFVQWHRQDCTLMDTLDGRTDNGEVNVAYETIRSIARHSRDSARVTLVDGREVVLANAPEVGRGNQGIYVDDTRYGRVLISWDAFERVEFTAAGSGPAYTDFPPGRSLTGSVTTRDGRRIAGRLVYDLDESESTETLDARAEGVDYTVPFAMVVSIHPASRDGRAAMRARVILRDGEELQFEPSGDLTEGNAGLLIFVDGRERPEYVPWANVAQIELSHMATSDR
jgi:hypothetical protein